MSSKEVADLDLNLLVALHALLHDRHVSLAAKRLGMSQPAMSRALARLREVFDDALFVRVKGKMEPTARARAIAAKVDELLAEIQGLVRPTGFDPKTAVGTIRIAAPDIVSYMVVPPLIRRLAVESPGLDLEIVRWEAQWREHLESGTVDLTIGMPTGDEPNIYARPLIDNRWACVLREGHPALRTPWDIEHFAALDHLVITLGNANVGPVDMAMTKLGITRRIALRLPYPALSPLLVAETDLVLTTTSWLARKLGRHVGLVIRPPPFSLPIVRVPMVWHERSHRDPKQQWIRDLLARIADEINASEQAASSSS
ncbi:MAG: LysR family transcriptional regulator [Polyangiaceae bacterium]|nr:LysR family transcriptional regulator [Polyangiaceae bacterium]